MIFVLSEVPLASHHAKVVAGDCAEVGNLVETAVDVGKSLVERYIKHGQLVVVADDALEECLIGQ